MIDGGRRDSAELAYERQESEKLLIDEDFFKHFSVLEIAEISA